MASSIASPIGCARPNSPEAAMPKPLDEFARIARFFAPLAGEGALGLKDDAALIDGPDGTHYVLTADAIVEGVHFLPDDPSNQIARKLLRVNLSDLAAKGAIPVGYLLTTALPKERDENWLAGFAAGLAEDQARFGIVLLGGDSVSTAGPVSLSLTAIGRVPAGRAILRRGARAGDRVYVSGTLGDAALGLRVLKGEIGRLPLAHMNALTERYRLPEPRLALGQALIGTASAAIDISDGLVADLGHLCAASGVGATIERAQLPLSPAAQAAIAQEPDAINAALGGGDDYELLFTVPETVPASLASLAEEFGVPITPIGRIEAGVGVTVCDETGRPIEVKVAGYRHF
jgi:thiamine-monophosphate kinase